MSPRLQPTIHPPQNNSAPRIRIVNNIFVPLSQTTHIKKPTSNPRFDPTAVFGTTLNMHHLHVKLSDTFSTPPILPKFQPLSLHLPPPSYSNSLLLPNVNPCHLPTSCLLPKPKWFLSLLQWTLVPHPHLRLPLLSSLIPNNHSFLICPTSTIKSVLSKIST